MNAMEIVNEIVAYIQNNGGLYFAWYAGIARDPRQRLFTEHGVNEIGGTWIFAPALNSETARAVEEHLNQHIGDRRWYRWRGRHDALRLRLQKGWTHQRKKLS